MRKRSASRFRLRACAERREPYREEIRPLSGWSSLLDGIAWRVVGAAHFQFGRHVYEQLWVRGEPGHDDVRRALAVPDNEITAEQLAVLRAAAEGWLAQQDALERAVVELRAFASEHGVEVRTTTQSDRRCRVLVAETPGYGSHP